MRNNFSNYVCFSKSPNFNNNEHRFFFSTKLLREELVDGKCYLIEILYIRFLGSFKLIVGTNCKHGKITREVFATNYILYFNSNWGHNSAPMTLPKTWTSSNKNTKKLLLHQLLFMARTTNQVRFFTTLLKFGFSEKAPLIWKDLPLVLTNQPIYYLSKRQNKTEIFFKFCGLLTMS